MLDAFVPLHLPEEGLVMEILTPWLIVVFLNFVDDYRAVFCSHFQSKIAPITTQICDPPHLVYGRHSGALGFASGSFNHAIARPFSLRRIFPNFAPLIQILCPKQLQTQDSSNNNASMQPRQPEYARHVRALRFSRGMLGCGETGIPMVNAHL